MDHHGCTSAQTHTFINNSLPSSHRSLPPSLSTLPSSTPLVNPRRDGLHSYENGHREPRSSSPSRLRDAPPAPRLCPLLASLLSLSPHPLCEVEKDGDTSNRPHKCEDEDVGRNVGKRRRLVIPCKRRDPVGLGLLHHAGWRGGSAGRQRVARGWCKGEGFGSVAVGQKEWGGKGRRHLRQM